MSKYQELKENKRSASNPTEEIKAHHVLRDYERGAAELNQSKHVKQLRKLEDKMKTRKENKFMTPQEYLAYRLERICPASRRRWMFSRLLDSRIVRRMA